MKTFKIDGRKSVQSFINNEGRKIVVVKQDKGVFFTDCPSDASFNTGDTTKQGVEDMVARFMDTELLITSDRVIDTTKPVAIYKNLHNGKFSVKQCGLVVAHVDSILLTNVSLRVSEAGRQRVLRDKQKNVHAYVVGMVKEINGTAPALGYRLSYNPYKAGYFVYCHNDNKARLHSSQLLYCDAKQGLFIAK